MTNGNAKHSTVAIVGFFNVENAGDERIRHVWTRLLRGHTLNFIGFNNINRSALARFDWVILGGGDILHRNNPLFLPSGHTLLSPHQRFGAAGMSTSLTYSELEAKEIQRLVSRAEFFFVRDSGSQANLPTDVGVAPDVSWMQPLEIIDLSLNRDVALILAPCSWKPAFRAENWVDAFSAFSTTYAPMYYPRDADLLNSLGRRYPNEFNSLALRQSRVVVSARLHGLIFALQLGRPIIAISYARKVSYFMKDIGLESCCFEVNQATEAAAKTREVLANLPEYEARVADIRTRLTNDGQAMAQRILEAFRRGPLEKSFLAKARARLRNAL